MGEQMHTAGDLYRYRDEDGDTIALAVWGKGLNGGTVGRAVARMPVPYKFTTREIIEANAARLMLCWNAHDDLLASLSEILNYDGGADHALDDPYVVQRAQAALARATSPNPDPNTAPSQADRAGGGA